MADIHAAESISLAHVQAALDAAHDGDTVIIPAGEVDWASSAVVDDAKKLYIIGNGVASSIIHRNSVDATIFDLNASGAHVGHLAMTEGYISTWGQDWRVHHCTFDNGSTWGEGIVSTGQSTPPVFARGLVDHCTIINARVLSQGSAYLLSENDNQHVLWAAELGLGDAEAVYVEDCIFSGSAMIHAVDCSFAGRYVFRHNQVIVSADYCYACEVHSSSGNDRAGRRWEIYDNAIVSAHANGARCIAYIRGGTGVAYNNVVTGNPLQDGGFTIDNKRDWDGPNVSAPGGLCNGSSIWDENGTGEAGWHCRDQLGVAGDNTKWNGSSSYDQSFDPAYFWGNTPNTIYLPAGQQSVPPHIEENRDYFLTIKSGYTPYTYPHPLQGLLGGGGVNTPQKRLSATHFILPSYPVAVLPGQ